MHDTQVLEQFIQLRVLGLSVPKIAKKMGVPASTLYDWNERARPRIQQFRLRRLEEAEESILGIQPAQFERLAHYLKVIDKQLAAKVADSDAANLTLPELVRISGSLRRQLHTLKFTNPLPLGSESAPAEAAMTEAEWPFPPRSQLVCTKTKAVIFRNFAKC